jgi:CRISPR/Cas system-associated exonuclease Cas4 (RecB family)
LAPFPLSKSSIDAFLKCERQFFYRKALRIPETDSAAMRMGSLFHKVMAALCDRFPSRADLVASATPEIVRDTVAEALRSDEEISKTPFYERLFRRHLEKLTGKMLDLEKSDPENCTIRGTEVPLLYDCGPWKFTGRMDRVHETPAGDKVIVDYKTGKTDKMAKTHRRKILAAPEDPKETNWQVPIYVWGVKTNEGRAPRAFTFMAASAREEPFSVTLFVCRDEADVPPHARKGKAHSYLLESEVEGVMETAVRLAGEIFAPARRFERTEDRSACRSCRFRRLCRREKR